MFLNTLNQEEKRKFLSLVYLISQIDGEYADEEKEIVENYKIELGTNEVDGDANIYDLIEFFASKNIQVKKVVIFEVYGLIISDEKIHKNEEKILNEIKNKFGLDVDTIKAIKGVVDELHNVYQKIFEVLV